MAKQINPDLITNVTEYPNAFVRQKAFPLDITSLFTSLETATQYAKTNPTAYVGQLLTVVELNTATAYLIVNEAGDIAPITSVMWEDHLT